ncbi:cytokine-like nuclear factor N-PAC [Lissotriton helveticus]
MAATVAGLSLRQGDLVWGKLGKYPPWPGKIVTPPKDLKKPLGKKCFFVKFFGTEDHAWIRVEQLKPYHAHKEEMMKAAKGKRFQQAVDAVEEFLKKAKARELAKEQAKEQSSTEEKKRRNSSEEKTKKIPSSEKRKLESKVKKASGALKKKTISSEMKKKILAREIKKKLLASTIKKKVLSAEGKKKLLTAAGKKKILGKKTLTASGKKKTGTKKILTADGKKILSKKILSTNAKKKKLLSADLKKKKVLTAEGKKKKVVIEGKKKVLNASGKKKIIAANGKKLLSAEGKKKKKMLTTDSKKKKNLAAHGKKFLTGDGKKKILTAERKKILSANRKKILLSTNRGSKSHLKGLEKQGPRKRGRPPKDDQDLSSPESSTMKRMMMGTLAGFKWQSALNEPVKDDPHFHHFLLSQSEKSVSFHTSSKRFKLSDEEMGSTSIQAADSTAANGSINPTDKRIGFLGLGLMGSGIVSNLLKMGHSVTVWNRTAEKCDLFVQEGARLGRTPAEVVSMCDITFSCVADPKSSKDLVLGPSGVLQGIRPGKCYVDMSTVDPDTVIEVSRVIVSRGGRFLEAPVSGNQQLSNDGMLVILAAGDRGVYEDCSSCFQAMGKASFFLGDVGNAAKMMLILSMVQGSFMATIAEGLTLAQVTGQSQQTLLDILNQGQLASIFLDQKCQNILQGNFKPDLYLKYIQKDLRLAIALGDSVNHPTPMAAAANEVYKRAKALDQSDNDMSAVYRAYIH